MKISLVGGATTVECQLKCQLELRGQAEHSSLSTNVDVPSYLQASTNVDVLRGDLDTWAH